MIVGYVLLVSDFDKKWTKIISYKESSYLSAKAVALKYITSKTRSGVQNIKAISTANIVKHVISFWRYGVFLRIVPITAPKIQ